MARVLQGRPPQEGTGREIVDATRTYMMAMAKIGVGFAGDEKNPRPLPKITVDDQKRRLQVGLRLATKNRVRPATDALYLSFYSSGYEIPPEQATTLSLEQFWWMLLPGDQLLLTNSIDTHYTFVDAINRKTGRLRLHDPWVDRFLLLENRNVIGAKAKIEGEGLVSIAEEEFRRSAVGLITLDRPTVLADLVKAFPDSAHDPELHFRFGLNLLESKNNLVLPAAIEILETALALFRQQNETSRSTTTAAKLFVANKLAIYDSFRNRKTVAEHLKNREEAILRVWSVDFLRAKLSKDDLGRMAHAAGSVRDWKSSEVFSREALTLDPDLEECRLLLAHAYDGMSRSQEVVQEINRALEINRRAVQTTNAAKDKRHPHDKIGQNQDAGELEKLKEYRLRGLGLRGKAYIALGEIHAAKEDSAAIQREM